MLERGPLRSLARPPGGLHNHTIDRAGTDFLEGTVHLVLPVHVHGWKRD
jgi:hypothetical protein